MLYRVFFTPAAVWIFIALCYMFTVLIFFVDCNMYCGIVLMFLLYHCWDHQSGVLRLHQAVEMTTFSALLYVSLHCTENEHHWFINYNKPQFFFKTSSSFGYRKAWFSHGQYFYSLCSKMVQNMHPSCPNGYSSYTTVKCIWLPCFYLFANCHCDGYKYKIKHQICHDLYLVGSGDITQDI